MSSVGTSTSRSQLHSCLVPTTKVLTPCEIARGAFCLNKRVRTMKCFRIRVHKDAFEGFCGVVCNASDFSRLLTEPALYLARIGYSFSRHLHIGFSYLCRLMASLFGNTLAAGPIEPSKQTGECKGMTTPCTGNQQGMQKPARTMMRGRDDRSQHDLHEGMHRQSNTAVRTTSNKKGLE